ncbi:putative Pre-mRNA-splicing factor 18 [Blattamonas nauphoetae]|uniref:Pre-mRNA-splicing factor 18 n=1 Tax=Blattamonas nauphoetae TaxID=2049346 RepID=A0ABQ9YCH6_9EUKA|nr:putative Pre-mRNA-splicing factor 18 [Blattamonas nauphoetae]
MENPLDSFITAKKRQNSTPSDTSGKKWKTRGEIIREEALRKQQEWDEKQAKKIQKPQTKSDFERIKDQPEPVSSPELQSDDGPLPSVEHVKSALRNFGEPATLFGENNLERFKRLRLIQLKKDLSVGQHVWHEANSTSVSTNRGLLFGRFPWDISYVEPYITSSSEAKSGESSNVDQVNTITEKSKKSNSLALPADLQPYALNWTECEKRLKANHDKYDYILFSLLHFLQEWEHSLSRMPDHIRTSVDGKQKIRVYKQCDSYIQPLLKHLRKKTLQDDLLKPITEICEQLSRGEFNKADETYMRLAIGNSPWPMGVTNTGIHERSAEERITTDKIAHILNDEAQRKYIHSLKRIMTFVAEMSTDNPKR